MFFKIKTMNGVDYLGKSSNKSFNALNHLKKGLYTGYT
jgi:hypothetical protein